jgi:hypothetical protein
MSMISFRLYVSFFAYVLEIDNHLHDTFNSCPLPVMAIRFIVWTRRIDWAFDVGAKQVLSTHAIQFTAVWFGGGKQATLWLSWRVIGSLIKPSIDLFALRQRPKRVFSQAPQQKQYPWPSAALANPPSSSPARNHTIPPPGLIIPWLPTERGRRLNRAAGYFRTTLNTTTK